MKTTLQLQITKWFMNASLSSRIFSLRERRLFVNWTGMSQCFEIFGTRQKPRNRWLAFTKCFGIKFPNLSVLEVFSGFEIVWTLEWPFIQKKNIFPSNLVHWTTVAQATSLRSTGVSTKAVLSLLTLLLSFSRNSGQSNSVKCRHE